MTETVKDQYSWTTDGVRLHWRDWPGPADRPALLCLPGLTRNCRDFERLARRLSARCRVLTPSLRGRGESGYASDKLSYVPLTYVADLRIILEDAGVDRLAILGTSLGGLLGLMLPLSPGLRLTGLFLNDIGPDIAPDGLARVRAQVMRGSDGWPSWLLAARDLARRHADQHPDWSLDDWLAYARRVARVSREGRIVLDFDPGIAAPMSLPNSEAALDLWAAFARFEGLPVTSLRGETSDILTADIQHRMASRMNGLACTTVPRVGHAPTLDEPEAVAAVDRFLDLALA